MHCFSKVLVGLKIWVHLDRGLEVTFNFDIKETKMKSINPEWEYFWSTLIAEKKELAQEEYKMSQTVFAFKKSMKRAFSAGRTIGQKEKINEDEQNKSAADDFANIRRPLTKEEIESEKNAVNLLKDLFGMS